MKNFSILIAFVTLIAMSSCQNNGKKVNTNTVNNPASAQNTGKKVDNGNLPVMTFEETVHDFGRMIRGEKGHYGFQFTNTGKTDLLITRVSTSCGCTVGQYPHNAVKPGEKETIDVTFDSTHKRGFQNKSITILANTNPNRTILRIKANVVMPEKN